LVPTRDHVVESSFIFYAVFTCHAARIAEPESPVNNSIFKSDPKSFLYPPDQKPSRNGCQQAKESFKTKITYFFVVDFFSLLTREAL
jgi:hypothetical protein